MNDRDDRVIPVQPSSATELWPGQRSGLPAPPPSLPLGTGGSPGRGRWIAPLAALVAVLVLIATLIVVSGGVRTDRSTPTSSRALSSAAGAVVDIDTSQQSLASDGLHPLGAGSGILLTADGEILTNNHVVEGASSIEVAVAGHSTAAATVVGVDPTDDIALLHLSDASGLPVAKIGDSSAVQVGDAVTAIGNAFGVGGTPSVTTGTVTAVHRSITASDPGGNNAERLPDVIQTDAQIHPGDSGGALVNADGQVVGIITAGPRDPKAGGGFAIPIDAAIRIVRQIEAGHGSSTILLGERGFLGVAAAQIDPATAAQLGLAGTTAVEVEGVFQGSPADRAGISAPAAIRRIDEQPIDSLDELGSILHAKTPGEQVRVTWIDQDGRHTATVTLIAGPAV